MGMSERVTVTVTPMPSVKRGTTIDVLDELSSASFLACFSTPHSTLVGEATEGEAADTSYGIEEIPDVCEWEEGGVNKARESEADKRKRGSKAKRCLRKEENGRMENGVKEEEEVREVNCEDGNAAKSHGRSRGRWRRLRARVAALGANPRSHRHHHRH
ncbi:hypothetical transcript [Echinococcus multilocularis]|uniref:Hypothetical transcript n=1 Tax=Echinococcus multilocularis TaxID=6211 RepID=A0A0S4MI41_ECHMU|nr:hypothetical transcript [Echinococcus multilocularis]